MLRITGGFRHETRYFFGCITSIPRLLQQIMEVVSHRGDVLCTPPHSPDLSHLAISFCGGTSKEKCTLTSHEIFLSCRMQLSGKCAPYLAECEQVMTNFFRRLNECVQNKGCHLNEVIFHVWQFFFKYSYGILKLQHLLYLLQKLRTFFHENWLCTTSFKTIRFHWWTLYNWQPCDYLAPRMIEPCNMCTGRHSWKTFIQWIFPCVV